MTDDTTTSDSGDSGDPGEPSTALESQAPATPAKRSARTTHGQTLFDRFISPILLPVGAVLMIVFVVGNLSRIYLSGTGGGEHGAEEATAEAAGHPILPVVLATVITVLILVFAGSFAAAKKMRSHTLAVFSVVALGAILFGGWLTVGDAQEKKVEVAYKACDAATVELEVIGFNSLKFDKKEYTIPAGCLALTFGGDAGHTLVFSEPPPAPFPKFGGPGESATYEIATGEYTIYCDVSGHRQGGMEAKLVVEEAA